MTGIGALGAGFGLLEATDEFDVFDDSRAATRSESRAKAGEDFGEGDSDAADSDINGQKERGECDEEGP
jgi:hypothetical protein